MVGVSVGGTLGKAVGLGVGKFVGLGVGGSVGGVDGMVDGMVVGIDVGWSVGGKVGGSVGLVVASQVSLHVIVNSWKFSDAARKPPVKNCCQLAVSGGRMFETSAGLITKYSSSASLTRTQDGPTTLSTAQYSW
jgi:hypothetical protein